MTYEDLFRKHKTVSRTPRQKIVISSYLTAFAAFCFFLACTESEKHTKYGITNNYVILDCQVDVIVTTAGGIEEDFIKCLAPTYMGDFKLKVSLCLCL